MTMTTISTTIVERTSSELSWPELYRRSGAAKGRRSEDLDSCGQLEPAGHGAAE